MSVRTWILLIAALIAAGALAKPLAERLRTPLPIIHALIGISIGIACLVAAGNPGLSLPDGIAALVTDGRLGSQPFLYGLLPTLLFQSALGVDIHRIRQDLLPILLLALVAVAVVTVGIGLALWPVAGMPLAVCLLLASVVATTDPVAVIAIFRGVGAPDHLVRLVESESLFNDAAAIALFVAFTALVVTPGAASAGSVLRDVLVLPAGGALIGAAAAVVAVAAMRLLGDDRAGTASLSLVLPYLVFAAAAALEVSGVIAVVAAGVTLATLAPARIAGGTWRYLLDVWELLAESGAVVVFILTSILVPRLLEGLGWQTLGLVGVTFVAALVTRAVVICGLFPLLARFGPSLDMPMGYRLVAVWGGLRGSMTLVLALAVTETAAMPREVAVFVATLATGYTLATLFVNGATLRPLMRRLRLDDLGPVDRTIRDVASAAGARRAAATTGGAQVPSEAKAALDPETALTIALVVATVREREVALDGFDRGTVAPRVARVLVAAARRRLDLARVAGRSGYATADGEETRFGPVDRLAVALQHRLGWSAPLAGRLERRYQVLRATAAVLPELPAFVATECGDVLGAAAVASAGALLAERLTRLEREIEALRLQYPHYAAGIERAMAGRAAIAVETEEALRLRRLGIVGADVHRTLLADIRRRAALQAALPRLDLGLDRRRLIDACALLAPLTDSEKASLAPRLDPVFAVPGMRLIGKGDPATAAYFLASGAVEVDTGRRLHRLGRGDAFGEMALIYDMPRQADVTAIAYCDLLRLDAASFRAFLDTHPALRSRLLALAATRLEENIGARREPD